MGAVSTLYRLGQSLFRSPAGCSDQEVPAPHQRGLAAMGHLAALRALGKPAEAEPRSHAAGARRTPDANEAE